MGATNRAHTVGALLGASRIALLAVAYTPLAGWNYKTAVAALIDEQQHMVTLRAVVAPRHLARALERVEALAEVVSEEHLSGQHRIPHNRTPLGVAAQAVVHTLAQGEETVGGEW